MSGGGVWTMNPNTEHPAEAWALLTFMNSAEQVTAGLGGQPRITNRDDVNAEVLADDPMLSFMAEEVLPFTHFRPGFAEYPQVSVALQEAVESVVTGTSPEDAAADYQAALEEIVGADAVSRRRRTDAPAEHPRHRRRRHRPAAESEFASGG